jgi:hypothetical protein
MIREHIIIGAFWELRRHTHSAIARIEVSFALSPFVVLHKGAVVVSSGAVISGARACFETVAGLHGLYRTLGIHGTGVG